MPFIAHPKLANRDRAAFTIVGQRKMDVLRQDFNELVANERTLAAKRRVARQHSTSRAALIALIGLIGSALLLVTLVVASIRSVARPVRRLSEAAQRLRAGEEVTVPESGSGELQALAASFNSMASELKRRERILENLSQVDALTGVANRRGFQIELPRALAAGNRNGWQTSLLMIDLDHFKAFNDEHGHLAGDALLRDAATNWLQELRISDTLARYGGEEFVVILPDCSLDSAFTIAERLRTAVPNGQSCSIGVASYMEGETPSDFTARADAALMSAKRHGRDRTHAVAAA
jgi:diguanylate cyclase (GGDEF)-like protein